MNIIIPSMLIAVSIAGGFLFFSPQLDRLSSLKDERNNLASISQSVTDSKKRYEESKEWFLNVRQEDQEKMSEVIPDSFDNVAFLLDLNNLAVKNLITIGPVDISSQEKTGVYKTYSVAFSFESTYSINAQKFLSDLENSLTLFDLVDMQIVNGEGSRLTYSIIFNTYAIK